MLIIALVLALIGLIALVFAVVTSNELVAWVCIGASILGVVLLIIDALRERQRRDAGDEEDDEVAGTGDEESADVDYPKEVADEGEQESDTGDAAVDDLSEEAGAEASEESAVSADGRGDEVAT